MVKDPFRCDGLRAVITGGGTGIGRATALTLAQGGAAKLVLLGRRSDKLEEAASAIRSEASHCEVLTLAADVGDPKSRAQVVSRLERDMPALDALINNAGYFEAQELANTTDESWRTTFAVNLDGPFALMRDLLPLLSRGNNPSVVNVSSTLAIKPIPATAAYNAAKAGLIQMTRTLALELGPKGVRVNAVLPAVVATDMYRARFPDEAEYQRVLSAMQTAHPLGRVGQPEDIAYSIRYLVSPAAAWVTGVALPVDGGMLCT